LSLFLDGKNVYLNGLFSTAPLSGKYCKEDSKKEICEPTNKIDKGRPGEDILDPIGKRTYAKPSMPAYYRSDLGVSLVFN
jgi:hypothetical protein